jgi:hypothetical protein
MLPDWTVPVDDAICARLRSCVLCGQQPEVLDIQVQPVGALVLAVARCLRCRNADPTGGTLTVFLAQRYGCTPPERGDNA